MLKKKICLKKGVTKIVVIKKRNLDGISHYLRGWDFRPPRGVRFPTRGLDFPLVGGISHYLWGRISHWGVRFPTGGWEIPPPLPTIKTLALKWRTLFTGTIFNENVRFL